MQAPFPPPRPPRALQAVSIILIVACLGFAGTMSTWLLSREWQEKAIAGGVMIFPLLLAFLQYRGTYRAHRRSILYVEIMTSLLCLGSAMPLFAAFFRLGNLIKHGDRTVGFALALLFLQTIFLATIVSQNESWRAELGLAASEDRLPTSHLKITLKEIFLLILAIAFMAGISSYFVRQVHPYQLLF